MRERTGARRSRFWEVTCGQYPAADARKIKVLIAMFFAVCFGALGDVSLKKGMADHR